MKLKNYLFAALALGLMSGCSEKDIISNETDGNKTESANKAYLSVKIALPTGSSATRTVNHKFDNGEAEEYQVNDVTLLFFAKGDATTEDDYVLRNIASTLESINTVENGLKFPDEAWNNVHESGGEITVTSVQTEVIGVAEDVCAVAALINISSEIKIAKEDLRIGKTFKDINSALELLVKDAANNDAGFIMTSSPMLDSGSGVASNFAKCDPKTTEQAAKENPATVKVERIVSKVALLESEPVSSDFVTSIESLRNIQYTGGWYKVGTADSYSMAYKIGEGVHVGDIISIEGWTLDVTNKTSFPFRKVDVATWIADYPTVWELISSNSRMYFAIDPNYDGTKPDGSAYTTATDFNLIDTNADFGVPGEGHPQYCLENTFDINHQTKDQTTRLIVKAKYCPVNNVANSTDNDGTWYALNQKTAHYSADVLKEQIFAIGKSENVFDASLNYNDVTIELTTTDAKTEVKSVVVSGNNTFDELQLAKLNSHLKITCYDKGYCYYPVRIRHFTDIELYGKAWVYIQPYTPNDLGRYGVVRNTSYQVQIKTISKPGDPEIPTTPNGPDDDDESYITCKIEILAWALRPIQDENL